MAPEKTQKPSNGSNLDCESHWRDFRGAQGHVFGPCCGSCGIFVQLEKFVEENDGRVGETLRSAKSNCGKRRKRQPCASTTTRKPARMNLGIRGIDANLGLRNADSFRADLHTDLKADLILINASSNKGRCHA